MHPLGEWGLVFASAGLLYSVCKKNCVGSILVGLMVELRTAVRSIRGEGGTKEVRKGSGSQNTVTETKQYFWRAKKEIASFIVSVFNL